jgi:hypothetical protein
VPASLFRNQGRGGGNGKGEGMMPCFGPKGSSYEKEAAGLMYERDGARKGSKVSERKVMEIMAWIKKVEK